MNEQDFPREIQNVTIAAQNHLVEAFGKEEGLEAFIIFCDILQLVRIRIFMTNESPKLLRLLPEIFRALGNSFELLNEWSSKNERRNQNNED